MINIGKVRMEEKNKLIEETEQRLNELGIQKIIKGFFNSKKVRDIITNNLQRLEKDIMMSENEAPEEIKSIIEKEKENYTRRRLREEVLVQLKINIFLQVDQFLFLVGDSEKIKELLKEELNKANLLIMTKEIAEAVTEKMFETFATNVVKRFI